MSYTCPRCGAVSHNPNDAIHRYCGRCHRFEDDSEVPLSSVAIQRIIEEVRNDKDAPLSGYNRVYHRHNR